MSPRRETSVGIAKCWLFSHATFDTELLKTVSLTCKLYYNKVFCGHPRKTELLVSVGVNNTQARSTIEL